MGMRDVRRLRGEAGRAIFREDIEKEIFANIFGDKMQTRPVKAQPVQQGEIACAPET
jgi:hypothetical protein